MKVINITPFPRYFSYANATENGRTLNSGQAGSEIPVHRFFSSKEPAYDMEHAIAHFSLSEEDKALLSGLVAHSESPVVVAKAPKNAKPRKPVGKAEAKPAVKPVQKLEHVASKPEARKPVSAPVPQPPPEPVAVEISGSLAALQRENARRMAESMFESPMGSGTMAGAVKARERSKRRERK